MPDNRDEHIGAVSIAALQAGRREFAQAETVLEAAAGASALRRHTAGRGTDCLR